MVKFFSLIKVQLSQIFSSIFSKNSIKSTKKYYIVFGLIALLLAFSIGSSYYQTAEMLKETGNYSMLMLQAGLLATLLTLLLLSLESQSHFFKTRDFEFLQTLPLKPFQIVSAKYCSLLVSGYIYSLIAILPAVVIYFMFAGFSFGTFLLSLIWILLFPLIPCLFASIIGLLIAFINSKAKHPQIVSIVFCIVFLILYFVYYFNYDAIMVWLNSQGADFLSALSLVLPSVGLFMQSLVASGWYILLYIAVNLLALVLTILLVASLYAKINIALNKSKSVKKGELTFDSTPVFKRFLKNESKMYFSNSLWVMNTLVMVIIACIMPLILYFSGDTITAYFSSSTDLIAVIFMIIMITMPSCNTACVSLSIEGKKFALLKALPVAPKTIMRAKISFNILLVMPFIVVAEILSLVLFGEYFNTFTALMLAILPFVAVAGASVFGMAINLFFPKTDYYSIAQVVKQSASSGIGMLGSIGINIIPFIIFLSIPNFSFTLFLILDLIYCLIWLGIWSAVIKFKGDKLFKKIS